jgi:pyruvate/2-oxoglutarate dehydrogenase complex dihydrolipoamide dehydrogenase (E3) component
MPHILNREDEDAAEILQQAFIRDGIRLILGCKTKRVERINGNKVIHIECQGKKETVTVDEILVGTGRVPEVEGLNLEAAG